MMDLSSKLFPPVVLTHETAVCTFQTGDIKWQKFLWCFNFFYSLLVDTINIILGIRQWNRIWRANGWSDITSQPFQKGGITTAEILAAHMIFFYYNFWWNEVPQKRNICEVVLSADAWGTEDSRLWVLFCFWFFWQEANNLFLGKEKCWETVFKPDKKGFGLFNMFSSFCAIRCLKVITDNSSWRPSSNYA